MWKKIHRKNNKFHSKNGPALVHRKDSIAYYLDGVQFDNFDEWCHEARISDEVLTQIKLKYGGDRIIPIPPGKRCS